MINNVRKIPKQLMVAVLAGLAFGGLPLSQAQASVVTANCAGATSCTLAELQNNGSITINDTVFNNWSLDFNNGIQLDETTVTVSGIDETTPGILGLMFSFDPAYAVSGVQFIEYDFDFTATSTRQLVNLSLEILSFTVQSSFVEVKSNLSSGDSVGTSNTATFDSTAITGSPTSFSFDTDIQMETEATGESASLTSFRYLLTLEGDRPEDPSTPVPAPPMLLLFLGGLLRFAYSRRHQGATARL